MEQQITEGIMLGMQNTGSWHNNINNWIGISVRENVCNISKKRKKSCFLNFQKKKRLKT